MSKKSDDYYAVVVKTVPNYGGGSANHIRAMVVEGQTKEKNIFLECSVNKRYEKHIGSTFVVKAKLTNREGGKTFAYSFPKWATYPIDPERAAELIKLKKLGFYQTATWDQFNIELIKKTKTE